MYGNLLPEFMISHISSATPYNVVSWENSLRGAVRCLARKTARLAIKPQSAIERKKSNSHKKHYIKCFFRFYNSIKNRELLTGIA